MKKITKLVRTLTMISQKSLETGDIPRNSRIANVTQIHQKMTEKSSEQLLTLNLMSQLCQMVETVLKEEKYLTS